jgi:hypothetical protein
MRVNFENMLDMAGRAAQKAEPRNGFGATLPELAVHLKDLRDRVRAGDFQAFDEFFDLYVFNGHVTVPSASAKRLIRPDILTHSRQYFNFLKPHLYRATISDFAFSLSKICRFGGHCHPFYSVAQHSVLVSYLVEPHLAFPALMHDCAEAFLGDCTKPLKQLLPDYRALEKTIEAVLFRQLNIKYPLHHSIKHADLIMLATEQRDLMPEHDDEWGQIEGISAQHQRIIALPPDQARDLFFARLQEVAPQYA